MAKKDLKTLITPAESVVAKTMAENGAKPFKGWKVSPDKIRELPDFNPRIKNEGYHAQVRLIADSIHSEGFYNHKPLAGFVAHDENVIYVTEGHCRLAAARLAIKEGADLLEIPIVPAAAGTTEEDLLVELVQGNAGRPFSPYELAKVCKRLQDKGWGVEEIAKRIGNKSVIYVKKLLRVINAPKGLRELVEKELVSLDTADKAIVKHGAGALETLRQALARAQDDGKEKLTAKHLGQKTFAKVAARQGPKMFNTLRSVQMDPGFKALDPKLRQVLNRLVKRLMETEGADELLSGADEQEVSAS